MSTATARTYRHGFSGWIAPAGSRKSPEIKSFVGIEVQLPEKHIVSKIASC